MKISTRSKIGLWCVLICAIILVGYLSGLVNEQGITPPVCPPQNIGVWGPIAIKFNQAMLKPSVEELIHITPNMEGSWLWEENNLTFQPKSAFSPGLILQINLAPGAENLKGERIGKNMSCLMTVREPQIVFQTLNLQQGELDKINIDGSGLQPWVRFKSPILSYTVAKNGENLTAAVRNSIGGVDLWLVDRNGRSANLLENCGKEVCESPQWSPDNHTIYFSKMGTGNPQLLEVDINTQKSQNLLTEKDVSCELPEVSPNGEKLAFFDSRAGGIRIVNLNGSDNRFLKTNTTFYDWSPDSQNLVYFSETTELENYYMDVFIYHIDAHQSEKLLNEYKGQFEFGNPVWSPDGKWITLAARLTLGSPSRQLVMFQTDGSAVKNITQTQLETYSSYQWSPDGKTLIFQGLELGSSSAVPQIITWDLAEAKTKVILNGGGNPSWLP